MTETTNRKLKTNVKPLGDGKMDKTFHKKTPKPPRFEGRCEELKTVIFDVVESKQRQAENFMKAMKEISVYVSKEYKYGDDVAYIVENHEMPNIDSDMPVAPGMTVH